jgi:hypothetical protein
MDITQHISIAINYELKVFLSSSDQVGDQVGPPGEAGQIAHPYVSGFI